MRFTPREIDKLMIYMLAQVEERRKDDGIKLNPSLCGCTSGLRKQSVPRSRFRCGSIAVPGRRLGQFTPPSNTYMPGRWSVGFNGRWHADMARVSKIVQIDHLKARQIWLRAQGLLEPAFSAEGADAVTRVIEHLGYVQIDTINVIERCHHHILWTRLPNYRRADLHAAQSVEKSVFEYWTHALSYIPRRDFRFFVRAMKEHRANPGGWYSSVSKADLRKVMTLVKKGGALTIRDIEDDVLQEKDHPWASRKPSKRALQLAFYSGLLAISERNGMLKSYELIDRHFGWAKAPKAASSTEVAEYLLDRALCSQGVVSLESICHLDAPSKAAVRKLIEQRTRRKDLVAVQLNDAGKQVHWASPETLDAAHSDLGDHVHILSPFDPLVIQRKRLKLFFGYEHRFEAYLPKERRVYGYFALPVLVDGEIVAAIDFKTDREAKALLIQKWTWIARSRRKYLKRRIEEKIDHFEKFQLNTSNFETGEPNTLQSRQASSLPLGT